jgi:hypothetical protein
LPGAHDNEDLMAAAAGGSRPTRSPGIVHAALLGVLVLVIATVALVSPPASPPAIAEFAPQAVEQIKDAPPGQSSKFGEGGDGACLDPQDPSCGTPQAQQKAAAATSTTTTVEDSTGVIDVPRVKRCVGDPPRQIEDPQSPPCVAYWKGDNGGATSKGVTATEIKIAWPSSLPPVQDAQKYTSFFNSRFQFYGRKLVVQDFGAGGGLFATGDVSTQIADAVHADEEMHAFASLSYPFGQGDVHNYYDELARRKVVTVDSTMTVKTEKENYNRADLEGYQWGYYPSVDKLERNLGTWACQSLAGHPAIHAGIDFQGTPVAPAPNRTFGVVVQQRFSHKADTSSLLETLSRCGVVPPVEVRNIDDGTDSSPNIVSKFQSQRISTIICICNGDVYGALMTAADSARYAPEFLVFGGLGQDDDSNFAHKHYPPSAFPHIFGIEGNNKINPTTDEPWFWALKEADGGTSAGDYGTFNLGYSLQHMEEYEQMLLLASGIQLAGPRLTPQTFKEGLMRAKFPNPGAGAPPYYQGRVGFGPGDHTMIDDVALVWYDTTRTSYTLGVAGTLCYIGKGQRWSATTWAPVPAERFKPEGTAPTDECK